MLTPDLEPSLRGGLAHKRRIVLVDDNVDGANALRFLLEQEGHEVELCRDGQSGLALARQIRPDIVLVDIGMPGLSGYEVAASLRADPLLGRLVIIAITGGWKHDPERVAAARFDHYLRKPVDFRALRQLIGTARQKA